MFLRIVSDSAVENGSWILWYRKNFQQDLWHGDGHSRKHAHVDSYHNVTWLAQAEVGRSCWFKDDFGNTRRDPINNHCNGCCILFGLEECLQRLLENTVVAATLLLQCTFTLMVSTRSRIRWNKRSQYWAHFNTDTISVVQRTHRCAWLADVTVSNLPLNFTLIFVLDKPSGFVNFRCLPF